MEAIPWILKKGGEIQKTFRKNTVGKPEEIHVGRKLSMSVNVYAMCGGVCTLGLVVWPSTASPFCTSRRTPGVVQRVDTVAFTVAFTDH